MSDQKDSANEEKKTTAFSKELNYNSLVSYLDKNIQKVQLGVYTVAFFGFVIAVRSVRPFKKFKHPREIPKAFFKKHVQLSGNVMRIDFQPRPTLLVDHRPLLLSKFRRPGSGLKVSLEGIDLMPNGVSWLQTVIVGQDVKFTIVSPQNDYVSSIVEYNKKDVANRLIALGFASVAPFDQSLDSDKLYTKYYKSLLKLESRAESKGIGMWSDASFNLIKFIFSKLLSNFDRLRPKSLKLN